MSNVEEILSKHVDKKSMDELSDNVWPDIVDAMKEYALQVAREAVEEELRINLWGPSRQAVKDVLARIESKLTEDE